MLIGSISATVESLQAALEAAFPLATIDRSMIDEPTANWTVYGDRAGLAALEGKTWRDGIVKLGPH